MKLENQNILIVSNEPWGDIWYSKHNYAHELSKKNKVFFINPPRPFKFTNFLNFKIHEKKISSELTILEYPNLLPVSILGFWRLNDIIVLKKLHRFFKKKNLHDIIFWTFDPIRLHLPKLLKPKKTILHIVDAYLFSYTSEAHLAKSADLILCVSNKIAENYKKYNSNVVIQPHAIPDNEFITVTHKRNNPIKALYIGKIDSRIDFEFNIEIFKSFPNIEFTLVGMIDEKFKSRVLQEKLKNVFFVPPIKSSDLKNYVSNADFCFIFKNIYSGNNIFSHKLLQYLAQGKPIFGTEFSDITPELKKALYISNDVNEIKKMITAFCAAEENDDKSAVRIKYANEHTFSKALSHIESCKDSNSKNYYLYYDKASKKTRFYNFFRKRFANPTADKLLAGAMRKLTSFQFLFSKLIAPEYLYRKPSYRNYEKDGIKMNLDISNLVDHFIYFSFPDVAINNFISRLKPTDQIIDVGTNIGYTTLQFSKACQRGNVISVEPSPSLFKTLTNHLHLNSASNVSAFNIGLAEKEKTAKLYQVSENNSGMNRILDDPAGLSASESIILKTLDQLVEETKTERVNAIKIDVEGYELNVLKGAYQTLKNKKPMLLVEVDDFNLKQQNASVKEMFELLASLDYSLFNAKTMQALDLNKDYSEAHFDIICFPKK